MLAGSMHEQEFVRSFIQKERRERCSYLLSDPSRRRKFTAELAHFKWLDERFATSVPASMAHTSMEFVSLLKQNGAGSVVWVISEDHSIDGRALPLQEAIDSIWGGQMGTVVSCVLPRRGNEERTLASASLIDIRSRPESSSAAFHSRW